mmetsp:Transcript_11533/g.48277  ORF Transcript_11533/g.48277 Transcript_11533/m.48277 type:complete len:406 (-) Transcript_11533:2094-3311(-)
MQESVESKVKQIRLIPVLVVRGDRLAAGDLGLPDLLSLLLLLPGHLVLGLLLLLNLDHVAEGVSDLVELHGGLDALLGSLGHPLGVTLAVALRDAVGGILLHEPRLRAERGAELVVVSDHHHAALVRADGAGEGAEGVAIEVVGGLVENDDVGQGPHGGGDDNLHLLTAGEGGHAGVSAELLVEANVLEVLLHVGGGERGGEGAGALCNLLINDEHVLAEAPLGELGGRDIPVGVVGHAHELNLVLNLLLHLLPAAGELLDAPLDLGLVALLVLNLKGAGLLDLLPLLIGEHHGVLGESLLVVAVLEAPADVLVRGLLEVLFDVVEGVLRNVSDARVGVLPHGTLLGDDLSGEELDHGGLADTVGSDARDARCERHLNGHVLHRRHRVGGVGVGALVHLHQGLTL